LRRDCPEVKAEWKRALGARRCLFGTDGPTVREDLGQEVRAVQELPLTDGEKESIQGGGFLELTGKRS
jgi:predicted TIM-barrel fold metal-dependent hydrolase